MVTYGIVVSVLLMLTAFGIVSNLWFYNLGHRHGRQSTIHHRLVGKTRRLTTTAGSQGPSPLHLQDVG